jgi:DMSO reductase anchor subunit
MDQEVMNHRELFRFALNAVALSGVFMYGAFVVGLCEALFRPPDWKFLLGVAWVLAVTAICGAATIPDWRNCWTKEFDE